MSNIKNPTLTGTETAVPISGQNAAIRNDGTDIIYVSAAPGISAGADGVVSVPAGQSVVLSDIHGAVYLLGTGGATVIGKDDNTNPFKPSAQGGSGADEVARTDISKHSSNSEIHVTAAEKAAWNAAINPNLLINPDFAVNQRGVNGTITATGYFVDRWKLESGTVTVNADGTLTLDGTISQTLEKAVGADVTASSSAGTALYDNSTKTFTLTAAGEVIEWAKLEIGGAATPYSPPDMATEIVKCKRFYQRYYASEMTPSHMINSGTHVIRQTIPEMRNTPQVSYHWRYGADENILIDSNNAPHAADFSTSSYTNKKLLEMVIASDADTAWCYLPMDGDSYCELSAEM